MLYCLVFRELLGLEPVSLMIKKSRLRWLELVEHQDDNEWVKRCMMWKVEGIRQRGHLKKTWWYYVKDDMESLGLSQKDAQFRHKWLSLKCFDAVGWATGRACCKKLGVGLLVLMI